MANFTACISKVPRATQATIIAWAPERPQWRQPRPRPHSRSPMHPRIRRGHDPMHNVANRCGVRMFAIGPRKQQVAQTPARYLVANTWDMSNANDRRNTGDCKKAPCSTHSALPQTRTCGGSEAPQKDHTIHSKTRRKTIVAVHLARKLCNNMWQPTYTAKLNNTSRRPMRNNHHENKVRRDMYRFARGGPNSNQSGGCPTCHARWNICCGKGGGLCTHIPTWPILRALYVPSLRRKPTRATYPLAP